MLPIKYIYLLATLLAILFLDGCLHKKQPEVAVKAEKAKLESTETESQNSVDKLAVLELSTPKSKYKSNEPIPLKLTVNVGKFDLPVEKDAVEGKRAFSGLTVKDTNGKIIEPQKKFNQSRIIKKIYQKGEFKRCVEGIMLSKNENFSTSLNDIREFYSLKPGKYSLQVSMELKVYHENFLTEKSTAIVELEQEIEALKADTKLDDAAREDAIESIRQEIEFLKSREKKKNGKKYLPLESLRGRAELKSNLIKISIA